MMIEKAGPRVARLYRYPVKGLSPEPLDQVDLEAGGVIPHDRAYAIENGPGRFDPAGPKHLPKTNFLMLMRDERRRATWRSRLRSCATGAIPTLAFMRRSPAPVESPPAIL